MMPFFTSLTLCFNEMLIHVIFRTSPQSSNNIILRFEFAVTYCLVHESHNLNFRIAKSPLLLWFVIQDYFLEPIKGKLNLYWSPILREDPPNSILSSKGLTSSFVFRMLISTDHLGNPQKERGTLIPPPK